MIGYKGFTKNLTAALGKGNFKFELGKTYEETASKTMRTGFHFTENPFDCLAYYPLGSSNRYVQIEAEGSIDEDETERVSCTKITLLNELTIKELAGYGMMYMVQHPMRKNWQQSKTLLSVKENEAEANQKGAIAIARGPHPVVKGAEGSILGLILEAEPGEIEAAKLFVAGEGTKADTLYTLRSDRSLQEVAV
ncbi:MAG: hypothetical protein IJ439_03715 [Tyzzerella sp.]|nr:hypothetical protein [Tyzzerella sp.]